MGLDYRNSDTASSSLPNRDSAWASRYAPPMSSKSLKPEQNERLRAILTELIDATFAGNVAAAARAMGLSQSLFVEFLRGARGAGPKLINAIADHTGRSIDDLYGRQVVAVPDGSRAYQRLRDHPDWAAAREEADELAMLAPASALDGVGDLAFSQPPDGFDGAFVVRMAEALATARPRRKISA